MIEVLKKSQPCYTFVNGGSTLNINCICIGRRLKDSNSCKSSLSRLKLTPRKKMLLEDNNSTFGSPLSPYKEMCLAMKSLGEYPICTVRDLFSQA